MTDLSNSIAARKMVADLSEGLDRPCSVCRENEGTIPLMIPHESAGGSLSWLCCERCAQPYLRWRTDV